MNIGVPREGRVEEYRVGLTPAGVQLLTAAGHGCWVEHDAGLGAGFSDVDYQKAGGRIVYSPEEAYGRADLVVKVAPPRSEEVAWLRDGAIVMGFLHLSAGKADAVQTLLAKRATAVAYEIIQNDDGSLPVLMPLSQVAGRLAPQIAATILQNDHGGNGILLGGLPGVPPAEVVIVGAGTFGAEAARAFLQTGASVHLLDQSLPRLQRLDEISGAGRQPIMMVSCDRRIPIDVALVHVSPPDDHGFCSFGVEVGVTKAAAQSAKMVIAQLNPNMPRTLGDAFIHVSKLDRIVPVDEPLSEAHMADTSDLAQQIAGHIVDLIPDGSTLQTGIGAIPDAVLRQLHGKRHLGIHTELISDGVIDLIERGVIDGEMKTLHPGKVVAGFILGTRRLFDFVDDNPIFEMHPTEYVNDPFIIAHNDRMVAINSAIEVDLTGQVAADSIGPRLYSGVGGQVDFIYGASRSRGGVPIIAQSSTAMIGGTPASKIVATLKPGAGVTTSRNHVHYVVTEHGVAALYGKTIRQRARALIDIAAPEFRAELEQRAVELKYL